MEKHLNRPVGLTFEPSLSQAQEVVIVGHIGARRIVARLDRGELSERWGPGLFSLDAAAEFVRQNAAVIEATVAEKCSRNDSHTDLLMGYPVECIHLYLSDLVRTAERCGECVSYSCHVSDEFGARLVTQH